MILEILKYNFSVCKIKKDTEVTTRDFCFLSYTDEEISLVCPTEIVPKDTLEREDGWNGFRIQGVLDFSLIGILSKISSILAANKIGIFAVSTYNTDYLFIKSEDFQNALSVLQKEGYKIKYL